MNCYVFLSHSYSDCLVLVEIKGFLFISFNFLYIILHCGLQPTFCMKFTWKKGI